MEQYNFRLKEYRKIALKFYLAPWRVLGIDKCAALTRAAAKHTPRKDNKNNSENQTERRGGAEPSPLNRLGSAAAFPPCDPFSLLVLPFRLPLEFCLFRQA